MYDQESSTIGFRRIVDRLSHRPGPESSHASAPESRAIVHRGRYHRAHTHVRIENGVAGVGQRHDQPLDQLDGELLTFGKTQTSLGFLPSGLPESLPALGPLKCRLFGYLDGTLIGSR